MIYRPDIDGLRAIAVIAVLFYHSHFYFFSGGYVGVDIFFVISGYLISSLIYYEVIKGEFTYLNFYERRARRILPPLFLVMLFCVPLAWIYMIPTQFHEFSNSLIYTTLFGSNILFWQESGYFGGAAELKPLLHTWSLAIEEQFYLIFPFLFVLAIKKGKKTIFFSLLLTIFLSLTLSIIYSAQEPTPSFYLLPTRAWELLLGVLVAVNNIVFNLEKLIPKNIRNFLSKIGLLLIFSSIVFFDENTIIPGYAALIPTVGTALVIAFHDKTSIVYKVLSSKPFVNIGLISYGLYLWHQPLFAFSRLSTNETLQTFTYFALIVFSSFLAMISYKFYETPIRRGIKNKSNNKFWLFILSFGLILILIGSYSFKIRSIDSKYKEFIEYDSLGAKLKVVKEPCEKRILNDINGFVVCEFGDLDSKKTVSFVGDSHYQAISYSLEKFTKKEKIRVISVKAGNCEIIPTLTSKPISFERFKQCKNQWDYVLKHISTNSEIIFFHNRWTFKMYPLLGEIEMLDYVNSFGIEESKNGYRQSYTYDESGNISLKKNDKINALKNYIVNATKYGKPVVIIGPVPEIGWDIAKVNYLELKNSNKIKSNLYITKEEYIQRNKFVNNLFEELGSSSPLVYFLNVEDTFCDSSICYAQKNGEIFYFDDDHLSSKGADLLIEDIAKLINYE